MKNHLLGFVCLLLSATSILAQSYNVKGIVQDTLGNPLIYSTVLLLEKGDSTMVDFTQSAIDGSFKFKDVAYGEHIVKTTYLGYIPVTADASSSDGNVDVGILDMTELAQELMEVVIKAAKAPIKMRGDTIEYDATTFKVPEGSTVEDLLRRLPGMEVEQDGSILADGKTVSKVTVDGKSFFGADPKAATKNLPAEGISKVQVFDTKTEEEEITGSTSQSQDKTMNLELKEDYKSGGFGRVVAGIGTEDRAELKGNYNRFNDKIQFSLVGVGNNTGRNGLSWDDYQDFMGSQSFNFNDDGDYGFGGGRGGYSFSFGGGNALESSIQSIFFSGGDNGGFPVNYNAGANFNYDNKKTKVSSVYYYNQAGLTKRTDAINDQFFQAFVQNESSFSESDNQSQGHRAEFSIDHEIDSLHSLKLSFNGAFIDQNNINNGEISRSRDQNLKSQSIYDNDTNTKGYLANGQIIFRKKFMKKGRRMGLNASFLTTELEDNWLQNSALSFFDDAGQKSSTELINQTNENVADKIKFKANALFVEPLTERFFFQTFYNHSNRKETGDRLVTDVSNDGNSTNEDLSRSYENVIQQNRIGSSLRYSHAGVNLSAGVAYQSFDLNGFFNQINQVAPIATVDKVFSNWIPNLSANITPVRNAYISFSMGRYVQEPEIGDLQPIINNINPLFIRVGNQNLVPSVTNSINTYISRSYPASGMRISLNGNIDLFDNSFSSEQNVDENLVTTYRPINVDGGNSMRLNTNFSFPIIKNKITTRLGMSGNWSTRRTIVNTELNNTISRSYNPSIRFNITPSKDFSVYLNGRLSLTNTSYDLSSFQDEQVRRSSFSAEVNSKLFAGIMMNTTLNYTRYTNDRFNQDQEIPILNASLAKQFLPGNKMEVRLSIYDALNQNIGFQQNASGLGVYQSQTQAIGRYVMLSLTYNIRGLKSDARKDSWW